MARQINRLSALRASKLNVPGQYADGGGLYLNVTANSTKSWTFRFMLRGRAREMGFGSAGIVSLAEAREKASEQRRVLASGLDPIEVRAAQRRALLNSSSTGKTFAECAEAFIEAHRIGWRNEKHANQWTSTLQTYAYPVLGKALVGDVDTAAVMTVLDPIWNSKTETAKRLRGRIEAVLAWATVRGFRAGANPAQWKNHLDHLLPAPIKVRPVVHHPALSYLQLGDFMTALRAQPGISAVAFEFLILTAARTSEVLGARWPEFDLSAKAWTIPASRMKSGREHRVPLSDAATRLLVSVNGLSDQFVFPGRKSGALSNMALLTVLRRMGRTDITAHGFRSTFRNWTAERTSFPREVAEAALAHVLENKVEAAYRRTDLFDKRRRLMEAWATYAVSPDAEHKVITLKRPA